MISGEPDLEVVGEAADGHEALELCRRLRPDLVLMDVRMPGMDGLAATRKIKSEMPAIGVLVVTTYDHPDYLFEAIDAGAAGYVLKDAPRRRLLDAVRRMLSGESPLNQELAMQLIRRVASERGEERRRATTGSRGEVDHPIETLTQREAEVIRLMALGKKNPEIARELVISPATAKTHVQRIIAKLGASDRTQAVVKAIESGLVASRPDR